MALVISMNFSSGIIELLKIDLCEYGLLLVLTHLSFQLMLMVPTVVVSMMRLSLNTYLYNDFLIRPKL